MSDTRYSLGPNITYRLLTEPSDLDIIWECTGWDRSLRTTDSEDIENFHSLPNFEEGLLTSTKAFEDGWVTKTGPQEDKNHLVFLIECDGNPMIVFSSTIDKINENTAREYGCASRLDEMNGKWAHHAGWRFVHPNYRGLGFNDFSVRGRRQLFVSDYGHNFCGANLEFSNRVTIHSMGVGPWPIRPLGEQDVGSNTDYVNYYNNIRDRYLSRPDEFEVITKPEWFGDYKIFVDKTCSLSRRYGFVVEINRVVPYWILSDSDWARSNRDLCEFEFDSGRGLGHFNFMKMFEFRDENGDLYYECPDYTKLSYDTSDQKFYINEPGYDFIQYLTNNIDISSVRQSPERTAQLLDRYKNI